MLNRQRFLTGSFYFCVAFFLFSPFPGTTPAAAGEVMVLVDREVAPAPVIVFEGAPPRTRQAAEELADYVEKTSGQRPEVIEGLPEPMPERAVWVGYQPVLDDLFPGLDFDFEHPEETLVAAAGSHLVIAGRDRWDPENLEHSFRVGGSDRTTHGVQQEYGTVNAVYTFLRDRLGVRWLWPGEDGEDILESERVAFEPFENRHHPQFRLRSGVFYWSDLRNKHRRDGRIAHDWGRFQRLFLDSAEYRGHAFGNWWSRFHESNPEYLALQPDGTRSGFPRPGDAKICVSNPAVWEQWLEDVEARLENEPTAHFFGAASNDANASGHCVCENCLAWDEPDKAQPRRLMWQGLSQEYVSLSDRDVRFGNELARLLRERYPGREYHIWMQAYGPNVPAPVSAVPDESIWFAFVQNIGEVVRNCPEGKTADEHFDEWAATGATMVYRPNIGGVSNPLVHRAMPAVFFNRLMDTMRFIADRNCVGLHIDQFGLQAWPTAGPFYYLFAHLAWDPYADGDAILDDYYRRGFGPAHEQVRAYWALMENTFEKMREEWDSWTSYYEFYDEDFFQRASGLLDEAGSALDDGAPDIYRRRLEHVRDGLEFTRLMADTETMLARYRESQGSDTEAAGRVRENWEKKMRIAQERSIHVRRLQGLKRRMLPED